MRLIDYQSDLYLNVVLARLNDSNVLHMTDASSIPGVHSRGVRAPAAWSGGAAGVPHDNQRAQTCTFEGPGSSKTPPNFNEKTSQREKKERNFRREREKKERNFGRSRGRAVRRRGVRGRGPKILNTPTTHKQQPPTSTTNRHQQAPTGTNQAPTRHQPGTNQAQQQQPGTTTTTTTTTKTMTTTTTENLAETLKHQNWPNAVWPNAVNTLKH